MMKGRKGFTLIELLIVVVIIGILAAIAIPKFANTKEKAYLAAMKSDLRNLATAQEAYLSDSAVYTTDPVGMKIWTPSNGVALVAAPTINGGKGWEAKVLHSAATQQCAIAVGASVNQIDATAAEGEPVCQ